MSSCAVAPGMHCNRCGKVGDKRNSHPRSSRRSSRRCARCALKRGCAGRVDTGVRQSAAAAGARYEFGGGQLAVGRAAALTDRYGHQGPDGRALQQPRAARRVGATLGYSNFDKRIESFGTRVAALVAQYAALVSLVVPASGPRVVLNDADDDHVIAAAVATRAALIVSGDRKHLLPIGSHQGISIVTAHEVVDPIEART